MSAPRDRVEIGVVARAHGIRGEVLVATHDPASDTLARARAVWLGDRACVVRAARPTQHGWLLALEGTDDRDAAEALRGAALSVARDALDLAPGEYLLADLVGCRVVRAGLPWGEIIAIDAAGAQARLVIHDGDVERLVPLVDALVIGVDVAARVVTVAVGDDWPEARIG